MKVSTNETGPQKLITSCMPIVKCTFYVKYIRTWRSTKFTISFRHITIHGYYKHEYMNIYIHICHTQDNIHVQEYK